MRNLKKFISKQDFVLKTETGKRVKIMAGKIYYGSYDFEHLDAGKGFLFLNVGGISQKVYMKSDSQWTERLRYFGHVHEDVEATRVEVVKRTRIVKQ